MTGIFPSVFRSDKGGYNNDSGDDDGGGGLDLYPPTHVHPSTHLSRSHPIKKCKNCDKQKEVRGCVAVVCNCLFIFSFFLCIVRCMQSK